MKIKLVISLLAPLLTTLLGFYAGYHIKRDQAPEANSPEFNPFLFASGKNAGVATDGKYQSPIELEGELIRITNQSFRYQTLPVATQEEIYKLQMTYYQGLKSILEEFSVRFFNALNVIGVDDVDIEELPPPGYYFDSLVKDEEVEDAYLKNLHQLRDGMDPLVVKEQIKIEMTIARASNFVSEKIAELKENDHFELLYLPPQTPLFSLDYHNYYRLRTGDDSKRMVFISSFFCEECRAYNRQFEAMVQNKIFQYDFFFAIYSDHIDSLDSIAHHVSECVYQQNPNEFWKYYFILFNFTEEQFKAIPEDLTEARSFFINQAESLAIDQKKLKQCSSLENKEILSKIHKQSLKLRSLTGGSIPKLFINDHALNAEKAEDIPALIEDILKYQPSWQR